MDRSDITLIVLEAYESQWRGDLENVLNCFDPQAQVTVAGDSAIIPFAGRYVGHAGLKDYLQRMDATNLFAGPQLEELLVDGGRAVVRWAAPVRVKGKRASNRLRFFDFVTIRDERIVSLDQYPDTAAATAAFGTDRAGASPAA